MLQCQCCSCPALALLTQSQHLVPSGRILQCHSISDLSESLPLIIHNCFFKKEVEESITTTEEKVIYVAEVDDVTDEYPLWSSTCTGKSMMCMF